MKKINRPTTSNQFVDQHHSKDTAHDEDTPIKNNNENIVKNNLKSINSFKNERQYGCKSFKHLDINKKQNLYFYLEKRIG